MKCSTVPKHVQFTTQQVQKDTPF